MKRRRRCTAATMAGVPRGRSRWPRKARSDMAMIRRLMEMAWSRALEGIGPGPFAETTTFRGIPCMFKWRIG
jgi:hypothetical protein